MKHEKTLEFAYEIYEKIPDDEVIFDFSKVHSFDPLDMLIMGATLRNYRMQYPEIPFKIDGHKGKSYPGTTMVLS